MNISEVKTNLFSPISIIILAAFGIRLTVALLFSPPLLSDEVDYAALGNSVAHGTGFSLDGTITASRAPAYPAMIAFCFSLFNYSIPAVRVFQAVADTLTCFLIFYFCRNIFSIRTAYIAFIAYALFPGNALYVSLLMTEIVFTTCLMASVLLATSEYLKRSLILKLLFGGALAVMTLLKPSASVIIIFFAVWEWYRSRSLKTTVTKYLYVAVAFAMILSPWMVRNTIQFGHAALTSNGGVNFWIGHNEQATGSFRYYAENNPLENVSGEFERSQFAFHEGLIYMVSHPLRELQLIVLKFIHLFEPDFALMQSLLYRPEWKTYAHAIQIYREFPPILAVLIHLFSGGLIIAGLWGLIFVQDSEKKYFMLMNILIAGWIGIHLVFFSVARYRIPLVPLFIILGANAYEVWKSKTYIITPLRKFIFTFISLLLVGSWTAIFGLIYLV